MKKRLLRLTALCITVAMVAGSVAGCGCGKGNENTLSADGNEYTSVLSEEGSESGSVTTENTATADAGANIDNPSESNQNTEDKEAVVHTENKGTNGNLGASTGSSKGESTSKGTGSSSGSSKKPESSAGATTDKTQTNTTTSNTGTSNSAGSGANTGNNTNTGSSTGSSVNIDNDSTLGSVSGSSSSGSTSNEVVEHTHNWVEVTEDQLEWVVDTEAWTEDIYEYRTICKGCGADITGFAVEHSAEFKHAYMSKKVVVDTVSHPEEGHYETKSVVTGYKCECGATK